MAIAPDLFPSNQKNPPADDDSVFTPIAPIEKPVFIPEPENPENPFVALSPKVTGVEPLPAKKTKSLPPDVASLLQQSGPFPAQGSTPPANRPRKPVNFLIEDVSIAIAPEFMPAKPSPAAKTAMDFSLDYKNPEAVQLFKSSREKPKDRNCHKCGKQARNGTLLNSTKGAVCPRCYNPYFYRLSSTIFYDQDPEFSLVRVLVATFNFFTAWIVPVVPAIIWYALFVRTGFGGFFEDSVTIIFAPTPAGLIFILMLLAGLFFIPACIASGSLGETVIGSFAQSNPKRLLSIIRPAMPGYLVTFFILTASMLINLAGIALCVEMGMGWASNAGAVLLAIGMSAGEMAAVRLVTRGRSYI